MTIRQRLTFSFLTILSLFAVNLGVYYWGNSQKKNSLLETREALTRTQLLVGIEHELDERRREISVLDQLAESGAAALTPEQVSSVRNRLDGISGLVGQLRELTNPQFAKPVDALGDTFRRLTVAWTRKYESFVANGTPAPANGIDPAQLSDEATKRLSELKADEDRRVNEVTAHFASLAALTDRITFSLFGFTSLVALAIALLFSRGLTRRLDALRVGAGRIGEGDLDYEIVVESQDELGALASTFNAMTDKLRLAHNRLTETNRELERQNHEIEQQQLKLAAAKQEAEEARAASDQASRAKSTFLANMSHELRTPMNAIIGYSEMLLEDAADLGFASAQQDLGKIRSAAKHLLALINDILDISKIEAGRMTLYYETFDARAMVEGVVTTAQPLADQNHNKLEVILAADFLSMRADETKVGQALLNLLSNACKFTNSGTITLEAHLEEISGRSFVVFNVSDTGIGMTAEQMSRLFREFTQADASTTRKYGGTGLGLAISRTFCRLMGGDITVTSQLGQGSTFRMEVPAQGGSAVAAPPQTGNVVTTAVDSGAAVSRALGAAVKPGASDGPIVLVVDDDADMRELATRSLAKAGFQVVTASSGTEALELALKLRPNAITLDVVLSDMDGWTVLTSLKARPETANIPVVMLTVLEDRQTGFNHGASEYLTKPINHAKLAEILLRVSAGSGPGVVLVVDDDRAVRQVLRRSLEREGWRVTEASDGILALKQVAESVPDLILLDLTMPRMDGFEFLKRLRADERSSRVPVVVLTGKDTSFDERAQLSGYVEHVIQKRDDAASLIQLTELVLKCARPRDAAGEQTHAQDPVG